MFVTNKYIYQKTEERITEEMNTETKENPVSKMQALVVQAKKRRERRNKMRMVFFTTLTVTLLLFSFIFVFANNTTPSEKANTSTIIVNGGDSLWDIAVENYPGRDPREMVSMICGVNGLNDSRIYAGQTLILPLK